MKVNVKEVVQNPPDNGVCCSRCNNAIKGDNVHRHDLYSADQTIFLCDKCEEKYQNELVEHVSTFVGNRSFETACKYILKGLQEMGMDIDEANFKDTPKRFARAYYEIFEGCHNREQKITSILSTSFPSNGCSDMVVARDIVCFSMCPHHILPVEYHVCVGYIPSEDGSVLGISKLARLVTTLAKRPLLQETFTHEIVDALQKIGVKGAIAFVEGQHMCMRMRGAKSRETSITTSAISGIFENDSSAKAEFMESIKDRKTF